VPSFLTPGPPLPFRLYSALFGLSSSTSSMKKLKQEKSLKVPQEATEADDAAFKDDRFKNIRRDPRFMRPKKKDTKVVIDDRFSAMLKNNEFDASAKVDKYGRPIVKRSGEDLKKYYKLSESEEEQVDFARGKGLVESESESDVSNADEEFQPEENDLFDRLGPFAVRIIAFKEWD
jgi:hypothetical protein